MMLKSIKGFWAKTKSKVLLENWSREKTKGMTVKSVVRSSEKSQLVSQEYCLITQRLWKEIKKDPHRYFDLHEEASKKLISKRFT